MQVHILRRSLLAVAIIAIQDIRTQVIISLQHSLYCPIFLGHFLKNFGNWKREPKNRTLSSSNTSEDSDDDIENHVQYVSKFMQPNITQKEKF